MEKADCTLKEFIDLDKGYSIENKIWIVNELVKIMSLVHERNILHRDLSPTNIFKVGRKLKIGDFGLGKNISIIHSHQTIETLGLGQYLYCSPEQMRGLRNSDKKSDVYSLGKIINYIFTKDAENTSHELKGISEKAINNIPNHRYIDAGEMYEAIQIKIQYYNNESYKCEIFKEIKKDNLNNDVETFLYELSGEDICKYLVERKEGFPNALLHIMKKNESRAFVIIKSIEENYQNYIWKIRGDYISWDSYAEFCYSVLNTDNPEYSYSVKEIAARILKYIARDINRFSSQDMINQLRIRGIEPGIEKILN